MCIKCKACGSDMDMIEVGSTGHLETLCDDCIRKASDARAMDEWDFEGLWWDKHWSNTQGDGKARYEDYDARRKAELARDSATAPAA